jgi:hypothetical protein
LENRIAGRKTNQQSMNYWFPTDTSMNRVAGLEGKQFDFGKPVVTTPTPEPTPDTSWTSDSWSGGA